MISYLSKLAIAVTLVIGSLSFVQADDILLNGDFADGKTHWHGDGDSPETGGRLVITLNPDKWTAVYQTFSAEIAPLQLKITYELSSDCTLLATQSTEQPTAPLTSDALREATGLPNTIFNIGLAHNCAWLILLVGDGTMVEERHVYIRPNKKNPYVFNEAISPWNGKFDDTSLCLAFPPGHGTVTLTKVELLPPKTSQ